jgi:hypothetical protein
VDSFNWIARFSRALSTSISPDTRAVLTRLAGIGSLNPKDESDEGGEIADDVETMGALGLVSRALPPEKIDGKPVHTDVLCLNTPDGLVPVAWRDVRLDAIFGPQGIKEGSTALAGYGGGFVVLDLTAAPSGSKRASILIAYCPYDYDASGVAQKAHSLIIDPEEGISFTHGDGYQLSISAASGIMFNTPSSGCWGQIKATPSDGGLVFVQAKQIQFQGNVSLGANVATAVPFPGGAASLPSPSVFHSLV